MDLSLLYAVALVVGFYMAWLALDNLRWEALLDPDRAARGKGLLRVVLAVALGSALGNAFFGFMQALLEVVRRAVGYRF